MNTQPHDSTPSSGTAAWAPPAGFDGSLELQTDRLIIRLYTIADAESLVASVESCRAEVGRWETWARSFHSLDDAHALIVRQRLGVRDLAKAKGLDLGVFERGSGRHVGGVGFHSLNPDTAAAEIGYWVRSDQGGHGYATEANAALLSWMLQNPDDGGLGILRVCARCSAENPASRRVLEKLGLALELHSPREYYVRGIDRITDLLGYGVLQEEWDFAEHRTLEGTPTSRLTPSSA